jgi:hypothetical protein
MMDVMVDAFVVGAGFSKAISSSMPVLTELSDAVVKDLGPDMPKLPESLPIEDIETWLSYLADDQPWLSERDNLTNRAAFLHVTEVLRSLLHRAEHDARQTAPPTWLLRLAARWHRDQATVITLNYDTLIEAAYQAAVLIQDHGSPRDHTSYRQLYPAPITPAFLRIGGVWGHSPVSTFRLLKLHGSISWFYSGRSSYFGETIYDGGVPKEWITDLIVASKTEPATFDKVPLIVPPTSGKSGFFQNEIVRGQWRLAREALDNADHIYCLGYSMPETDHLMRFMLAAASTGKDVYPVNRSSGTRDHYAKLLPAAHVRADHVGPTGVAGFVDEYAGEAWTGRVVDVLPPD